MKRALGVLCAGLLLAGAGCTWNAGNTRVEAEVKVNDQSLDVALDEAALRVQKELQRRGLEVTAAPNGDGIRLVAKAKSGDQFSVLLNRVHNTAGKDQTQVHVEWGAKADRELWVALMLALGASAAQAGG